MASSWTDVAACLPPHTPVHRGLGQLRKIAPTASDNGARSWPRLAHTSRAVRSNVVAQRATLFLAMCYIIFFRLSSAFRERKPLGCIFCQTYGPFHKKCNTGAAYQRVREWLTPLPPRYRNEVNSSYLPVCGFPASGGPAEIAPHGEPKTILLHERHVSRSTKVSPYA